MKPSYIIYNAALHLAAPLALPALAASGRLGGTMGQVLGASGLPRLKGGPRVWVHAVSFGEVAAAAPVMRALGERMPGLELALSTSTVAGREAASRLLDPGTTVFTFPLDVLGAPGRVARRLKPDLLVLMEAELWPNVIRSAHLAGARILLANARISEGSARGYARLRPLVADMLGYIDRVLAITEADARRLVRLGAPADRVSVAGNAKYDNLLERVDGKAAAGWKAALGIEPGDLVLVAGSTHPGEEEVVLDAFARLKKRRANLKLILAPRHVGRAERLEGLVSGQGLATVRLSRAVPRGAGEADVILVDVMGRLFELYSLASAAFVGGSLGGHGGQNPLEPACWGVPVVHGGHMENFPEAVELLGGAALVAANARELDQVWGRLLDAPDQAARLGQAARAGLAARPPVSHKTAQAAARLLGMDK